MRAFRMIHGATSYALKDPQIRSYVAHQAREKAEEFAANTLWGAGEYVTDKIASTFNSSITPPTMSRTFNSFSPSAMQEQESNRYRT